MNYLYDDGTLYHFINTETYEQITLDGEALGDAVGYLLADTVITLSSTKVNQSVSNYPELSSLR